MVNSTLDDDLRALLKRWGDDLKKDGVSIVIRSTHSPEAEDRGALCRCYTTDEECPLITACEAEQEKLIDYLANGGEVTVEIFNNCSAYIVGEALKRAGNKREEERDLYRAALCDLLAACTWAKRLLPPGWAPIAKARSVLKGTHSAKVCVVCGSAGCGFDPKGEL